MQKLEEKLLTKPYLVFFFFLYYTKEEIFFATSTFFYFPLSKFAKSFFFCSLFVSAPAFDLKNESTTLRNSEFTFAMNMQNKK